jgi:hypothetical protein
MQRASPGFRDRILTVSHKPGEGGLNLDMTPCEIETLANSGQLAGEKLVAAFATAATSADDYWVYHRWVRLRSLLGVLQPGLKEIHSGVTNTGNSPTYPDLLHQPEGYVGKSYYLTQDERDHAAELLDDLARLHEGMGERDYARHAPKPKVALKIQPQV